MSIAVVIPRARAALAVVSAKTIPQPKAAFVSAVSAVSPAPAPQQEASNGTSGGESSGGALPPGYSPPGTLPPPGGHGYY